MTELLIGPQRAQQEGQGGPSGEAGQQLQQQCSGLWRPVQPGQGKELIVYQLFICKATSRDISSLGQVKDFQAFRRSLPEEVQLMVCKNKLIEKAAGGFAVLL